MPQSSPNYAWLVAANLSVREVAGDIPKTLGYESMLSDMYLTVKGEISFAIAILGSESKDRMAFAETEEEWAERFARHLKAELKRAGVTYEESRSD